MFFFFFWVHPPLSFHQSEPVVLEVFMTSTVHEPIRDSGHFPRASRWILVIQNRWRIIEQETTNICYLKWVFSCLDYEWLHKRIRMKFSEREKRAYLQWVGAASLLRFQWYPFVNAVAINGPWKQIMCKMLNLTQNNSRVSLLWTVWDSFFSHVQNQELHFKRTIIHKW